MELLTSPWVIIVIIMSVLIGNIVAFKYLTPKNLKSFTPKNDDLKRLLELDKKHQQELKKKDD
jgi:beta-lactamase regulating signal transducer with metallopeptidase domain